MRFERYDGFRLLNCRGNKEKMKSVVSEWEEYRHLSEDTYDILTVMLNNEELLLKKQEVCTEGGFDMCQAIKGLIEDGKKEGIKEGEFRLVQLGKILVESGRSDELGRIMLDQTYREKLYQEFKLLPSV